MGRINTDSRKQRNNRSGKGKGRKTRGVSSLRPALRIVLIALGFAATITAILLVRELYYFITGNDVTDDNQYPVKGVDVSSYQLEIDLQGLEDEGYVFAFIKATEGSDHVDKRFEYNWKEANETNIRAGAYHFLSYDSDAKDQAENFIATVDKKYGMLPPAVDVEFYGKYSEDHPSADKLWSVLDEVLAELENHYGEKPIIYTNTYIYNAYISGRYDDYDIWISADTIPQSLNDGNDWTFCQYTFYGKSDSVAEGEKYVDLNVFNGSSWDFHKKY